MSHPGKQGRGRGGGGGGQGCFNCGQTGHISRECPNKQQGGAGGGGGGGGQGCFHCGQTGHFARECPNKQQQQQQPQQGGGRGGGRGGRGGAQSAWGGQSQSRGGAQSRPISATSSPPPTTTSTTSALAQLSLEKFDIPVPIDDTKSESSSDDTTPMSMPLTKNELVPRMAPGKLGKQVQLITNYFRVNFAPKTIYSHLVKFEPELQPKQLMERRRTVNLFGNQIRSKYDKYIFDGSTQILTLKEKHDSDEFEHKNSDGTSTKIKISFIKAIPTDDATSSEVDMVVNIMFKQQLRAIKLLQFGRAYYYPEKLKLQQNIIDMYRGFQAAINPTLKGLQLCVDLSHKVIQRRNMRIMMAEIEKEVRADMEGASGLEIRQAVSERVNRDLKGVQVLGSYNQRTWRVDFIDYNKSIDDEFPLKDGSKTTFRAYYLKQYGDHPEIQQLKRVDPFPGLLVNVQKRKGKNKGDIMNNAYLIPELCYLTGITDTQRTDTKLMKMLAQETRKGPSQRVEAIEQLIKDIVTKYQSQKDQQFPLSIEQNATTINARILDGFMITLPNAPPHKVVCTAPYTTSFQRDVTTAGCINMTGAKSEIKKIGFLCEANMSNEFKTWSQNFIKHANKCGVSVTEAGHISVKQGQGRPQRVLFWGDGIRTAVNKSPSPECLICCIPDGDEYIYSFIKHQTTTNIPIITQCVTSYSIQHPKLYMPIIGNSFKQVMAKMNHMLWNIDLKQVIKTTPHSHNPNTMWIGLDVCHDKKSKNAFRATKDSSTSPASTVGFVASLGKDINAYYSQIAIQGRYEEYVRTSRDLMVNALRQYQTKNGKLPDRVIVYRDGVGNSQLESFVRKEIREYDFAFKDMNCKANLTVIVVQKRISQRFFAACEYYHDNQKCSIKGDRCDGKEPYHSPNPGTVVDGDVTSQLFSDFYLIPSISPPGATSRPTRFIVIRDDTKFTTDDMQGMTNALCYMYYNWPGPIRVPSMCMYAHKIAYLFGKYVYGEPHAQIRNKLFYL